MGATQNSVTALPRERISPWLGANLGIGGPLEIDLIAGGRSNLTYRLRTPERVLVLRRPPSGDLPRGAHDVLREARLLSSLHPRVPVPRVLATCEDLSVIGAPFIVMEHLSGTILRSPADVEALAPAPMRAAAGASLVDALVRLHEVPVEGTSLRGLAARRDFLARQLHRWDANWKHTRTRDLPDLAAAHAWLQEHQVDQVRSAIVHGDYRLDNCMLDAGGQVIGGLDWELATVGDPMADLGQLLVYWADPGDDFTALADPPTVAKGFSTRADLAQRYLTARGEDERRLQYFLVFNWWKVACIVENVYSRMLGGVMGEVDRTPESFGEQARALAAMAWKQAQGGRR